MPERNPYNRAMPARVPAMLLRLPALLAAFMIRAYQAMLSPLLVGSCKFCPSCSEYAREAIREWGLLRGGGLAVRRILRCTPFGMGGIDPVPKRDQNAG